MQFILICNIFSNTPKAVLLAFTMVWKIVSSKVRNIFLGMLSVVFLEVTSLILLLHHEYSWVIQCSDWPRVQLESIPKPNKLIQISSVII